VKNGHFRGFIDVGDLGVGEKWRDIALCYRSLLHNADGTYGPVYPNIAPDRLFSALGIAPDWEKVRYYRLLDELF
jgi:kanamycin kinase/aminoglycoside 3'-phosphotransferase-3